MNDGIPSLAEGLKGVAMVHRPSTIQPRVVKLLDMDREDEQMTKKNTTPPAAEAPFPPGLERKGKRGPKPGFKRIAKAIEANNSPVRFSVDEEGAVTLSPESSTPVHLDVAATKRLEVYLERTKALRK